MVEIPCLVPSVPMTHIILPASAMMSTDYVAPVAALKRGAFIVFLAVRSIIQALRNLG